jgi:hypothetical protein
VDQDLGSLSERAAAGNPAAMGLDNPLRDCEAQSGAARMRRACFVGPVKAVEHPRKVVGTYTVASVAYAEARFISVGPYFHTDLPTNLVVLDGVRTQVRDQIGEAVPIADNCRCIEVRIDADPPLFCQRLDDPQSVGYDRRKTNRRSLEHHLGTVGARQCEQSLDDLAHAIGGSLRRIEAASVLVR